MVPEGTLIPNGIFEISTTRGSRKVIVLLVLSENSGI